MQLEDPDTCYLREESDPHLTTASSQGEAEKVSLETPFLQAIDILFFLSVLLHICEARLWQMQNTCVVFFMSEWQGIVTFKAHGGKRMSKHSDMKGRIDHCIYGLTSRSITHPTKCHWCHCLQAWGANWHSCSWTQYFCWPKNPRWRWIGIQRSCRWSEERWAGDQVHSTSPKQSQNGDTVGLGYLPGQAKSGKTSGNPWLEDQEVNSWNTNMQLNDLSFKDIIHSLSTAWTRNFRFAFTISQYLLPTSLHSTISFSLWMHFIFLNLKTPKKPA